MSLGKTLRKMKRGTPDGVPSISKFIDKALLKSFPVGKASEIAYAIGDLIEDGKTSADPELWALVWSLTHAVANDTERTRNVVHPSALYDGCDRKTHYDLTKAPITDPYSDKPSARLQRIFDTGHYYHSYLQLQLFKAGVLLQAEAPVRSLRYRISGKADGILKFGKGKAVLEIKSIASYGFAKVVKQGKPLDNHLFQVNVYAYILGIDDIVFLYINKDTQEIQEYVIKADKKLHREIKEKLEDIRTALKRGEAPKRACRDMHTKRALSCIYCTHCFSDAKTK